MELTFLTKVEKSILNAAGNSGKNLARYAPVKTNGMISLFDVGPDVDNLVRYSPTSQNHSLFDKEVSTNVFRSSWVVELDGIGITKSKKELPKERQVNLSKEKKEHRIKLFLEAIFNLWHR